MNSKCGENWLAAQIAEEIATLAETAYGWDSFEAASAYKNV
jgi:hypothetical protein